MVFVVLEHEWNGAASCLIPTPVSKANLGDETRKQEGLYLVQITNIHMKGEACYRKSFLAKTAYSSFAKGESVALNSKVL